jgi:protein-tyrosine phosphatase
VRRILILCYGNICRSPMAEGYMRKLLNDKRITDTSVGSAGIGALSGYPASEAACAVAARNGFSIDDHRSRQITLADLLEADHILVMERYQLEAVRQHLETDACKAELLGKYGSSDSPIIDDPYGGDEEQYEIIFERIREAVEGFLRSEIQEDSSG